MSALAAFKKEYKDQQAIDLAWIDFIATYEKGALSIEEHCKAHKLSINGFEIAVSTYQYWRFREKLRVHKTTADRRKENSGRPGCLSTYAKYAIFEDFLNFENLGYEGHCRLLKMTMEHDRRLDQEEVAHGRTFTYDQVRRFVKSIPNIYATYAAKGYKGVREKHGPNPFTARWDTTS